MAEAVLRIKFDLDDPLDASRLTRITKVDRVYGVLWRLREELHKKVKYAGSELSEEVIQEREALKSLLRELLEEANINLDEEYS